MRIKHFIIFLFLSFCALSALAMTRPFPKNAKTGTFSIVLYPQILINGEPQRLSAGAQIIGKKNTVLMPTGLINNQYFVRYTFDHQGNVSKVWILTDEEIAQAQAIP